MNEQARQALLSIIEIVEYLYIRNAALEQVLQHYQTPDWREIADEYCQRQENKLFFRTKFSALHSLLALAQSDSEALEALLRAFPTQGKPI
jgi:hypothetical protein